MIGEGMKVRFIPHFAESTKYTPEERREAAVTATVVYINWEHKCFTVEWESIGGTLRETFKLWEIGEKVKVVG